MSDRFSSFTRGLAAPYDDAVALTPSDDEFEPTAAIWVNAEWVRLAVVMMDSDEVVTLTVCQPGELQVRIKKLIAAFDHAGQDVTIDTPTPEGVPAVPVVVALY